VFFVQTGEPGWFGKKAIPPERQVVHVEVEEREIFDTNHCYKKTVAKCGFEVENCFIDGRRLPTEYGKSLKMCPACLATPGVKRRVDRHIAQVQFQEKREQELRQQQEALTNGLEQKHGEVAKRQISAADVASAPLVALHAVPLGVFLSLFAVFGIPVALGWTAANIWHDITGHPERKEPWGTVAGVLGMGVLGVPSLPSQPQTSSSERSSSLR